MRNIEAERRFLGKVYLLVGWLFFLGIIFGAIGTETWLIINFQEFGFSIFLILQGIWCIAVSLVLAFIITIAARELGHK